MRLLKLKVRQTIKYIYLLLTMPLLGFCKSVIHICTHFSSVQSFQISDFTNVSWSMVPAIIDGQSFLWYSLAAVILQYNVWFQVNTESPSCFINLPPTCHVIKIWFFKFYFGTVMLCPLASSDTVQMFLPYECYQTFGRWQEIWRARFTYCDASHVKMHHVTGCILGDYL